MTGFDEPEIAAALIETDANVSATAKLLNLEPQALRAFVRENNRLSAIVEEMMEQGVDAAVSVLFEAVRDSSSFQNRYYAAREWLRSDRGRKRGFGAAVGASVELKSAAGALTGVIELRWLPDAEPERKLLPSEGEGDIIDASAE